MNIQTIWNNQDFSIISTSKNEWKNEIFIICAKFVNSSAIHPRCSGNLKQSTRVINFKNMFLTCALFFSQNHMIICICKFLMKNKKANNIFIWYFSFQVIFSKVWKRMKLVNGHLKWKNHFLITTSGW